jgi:HD-GYP domain-containing protein (c-di-GMP phosphodiesterase class II)
MAIKHQGSRFMLVEHDITDICVGMYIVEITVSKNKYRLAKPGLLENELVIDALKRKSVEKLLIDLSKSRVKSKHTEIVPFVPEAPKAFKHTFNQEAAKAKSVFNEAKLIQQKLFRNAQKGLPLELVSVRKITTESTDIIFNNPNALACVLNLRNKDEYLLEHSVAVSLLMTMFAVYLKIDKDIVNQLAIGAFLHDVGKIMVPDNILNKPDKLTADEFYVMKSHASHSINIMKNTPGISAISLEVASQHHEKLNGKGYPLGLKAEKISRYGRMISICDIFDALTSTRCYKAGYPQVKAFGILRTLAAKGELDITLVDNFIRCMGVYPVGSVVQLDSNRLAIVESHNSKDPIRPNVRPFYLVNPKHFELNQGIDLSAESTDQIVKGVRADDFDLDMNQIIEFLSQEG